MTLKVVLILKLILSVSLGFALVDMRSGGYIKSFADIKIPGSPLLQLVRTYSSRSLFKGEFGYGWCSNLETKVEILPDNTVNVVECGGGKSISFTSSRMQANPAQRIASIMKEARKNKSLSRKYLQDLQADLNQSTLLQMELIRKLGLSGEIKAGQRYQAKGRPGESLKFDGRRYVRTRADNSKQIFNRAGFLIEERDSFGNYIKIKRNGKKIARVMDNKGQALIFRNTARGRITVTGPKGLKVEYVFRGDNLHQVKNNKSTEPHRRQMDYRYDNYHNLTSTQFSDGTREGLSYNNDKDWVIGFKNRRNCRESYAYKANKRNKNHQWADVRKVCGKQVTNVSRYEFWNKKLGHGGLYLSRARKTINGRVEDVTFTQTGSPKIVVKNGVRTNYNYDAAGKLLSRTEPGRKVVYSNFNKRCKKPGLVKVNYLRGKKIVQQVKTKLAYGESDCLVKTASQPSTGKWVEVRRDSLGRIKKMWDQSHKEIVVNYDERFANKPRNITRPGVGSIEVSYLKNGQMNPNQKQTDPAVVTQVATVFNGFMEVVSPMAQDISI